MVRQKVASVDDWIAEGLVGVINAHLGTNAPSDTFLRASLHFGEMLEIVLDTIVPVLRSNSLESFITHLQRPMMYQS